MCGILYCKVKSSSIDKSAFEPIFEEGLEQMNYRGVDSKGIEIIKNNYFGHVRLSIIDLKSSSNQPFQDEKNLMIFNGEIYNYKEIDPESNSDTKTLFNCMQTIDKPFEKLRGMFAFGWYDKACGDVSFFRDIFGEKPLYYYSDNDVDIVSSTLKSIKLILKKLNKEVEVNKRAIREDFMLFGYIRGPETIWKGIWTVPPGKILKISNNVELSIKNNYFAIENKNFNWGKSNYITHALASKDVSGTLLLSGGVDSTFLLAKAVETDISLRLGIYKANREDIDESQSALMNYEKICTNKSRFPLTVLSSSPIEIEDIGQFCELLEQPTSDGLQLFHLLKHLKQQDKSLKLVYTGLGGDEMFGGYPTFYNYKLINLLVNIPFSEYLVPKVKRFKEGRKILKFWNTNVYSFLYRIDYNIFKIIFENESIINIYKKYLDALKLIPSEINEGTNSNFMKIKNNEMFQYCSNQLLRDNDNISMALGLESRSPLLNMDWYFQKDSNKSKLKRALYNDYRVTFGDKKGFTLDEINDKSFFKQLINKHIKTLSIYLPEFTTEKLDTLSLSKLRSVLILLIWLDLNDEKQFN